jgi:hypothetical protein
VSEPNFSSKTAEIDDPLLCQAGLGRSPLPYGASLSGRFAEYRKPGMFIGKGWMQVTFDRIVLTDQVLPLSTKVVDAPHLKVDSKGRIRGRGHAGRDVAGWLIPPLWPWKVVSLPLRGPTPALKGESRLTLKLMDDVVVPVPTAMEQQPGPAVRPGRFSSGNGITPPDGSNSPSYSMQRAAFTSEEYASKPVAFTLLMLKDGTARVATDYWFENGQRIQYRSVNGSPKFLPIESLDLSTTVETNRQRGVEFIVRSQNTEELVSTR